MKSFLTIVAYQIQPKFVQICFAYPAPNYLARRLFFVKFVYVREVLNCFELIGTKWIHLTLLQPLFHADFCLFILQVTKCIV